MIEEKKVWKRFTGYKNIEANPDSVVMLLIEMEDGWRWHKPRKREKIILKKEVKKL